MKVLTTGLIAATLALVSSCDRLSLNNDQELPPITMVGNNTFGCLLNGKTWTPISNLSGGGIFTERQIVMDTVGLNIYADNGRDNDGFTLSVYDSPAIKIGEPYDLTDPKFFVQYSWHDETMVCSYEEIESGNIIFSRFDLTAGIVAGTFKFSTHSLDCTETFVVTQGRFDLTF